MEAIKAEAKAARKGERREPFGFTASNCGFFAKTYLPICYHELGVPSRRYMFRAREETSENLICAFRKYFSSDINGISVNKVEKAR